MKKSINLLSILLIATLLSCTGEVIKQNVSIDTKPTPSVSKLPIGLKPSPIESPSPKIEEKKYPSAIFSFTIGDNSKKYKENIFEAPILPSLRDEITFYEKTSSYIEKGNFYEDGDIDSYDLPKKINLEIIYPDGTIENDCELEVIEPDSKFLQVKDKVVSLLRDDAFYKSYSHYYVKAFSKKNKQIFKFFEIFKSSRRSFRGKVLDPLGNIVEGAKVSSKTIDLGLNWLGSEQTTNVTVEYEFLNAPLGTRILITVTKDGWTTRQRTEVLKDSSMYPHLVEFNFEGIYAIQDEPEITSIKVNGKSATATGPSLKPDIENLSNSSANLSGLDNSKLEIEITFSEPIITSDIENYFRVTSQDFGGKKNTHIVIEKNTEGIKFEWFDNNKKVKISLDKQLIVNNTGSEARYLIDFVRAFRDLKNNEARAKHYIRFNPANSGDFLVFSIKNTSIDKE